MSASLRRAVFLDRDGVLIRSTVRDGVPHPPQTMEEMELLPQVNESLRRLCDAGFVLVLVTNQPDVARGTQTRAVVESMNSALLQSLPLTAAYACFHDNADRCSCRKPLPGMMLEAAVEHGIDLSRSFMVGDRWSDIVAGQAAGCRSLLIDLPYSGGSKCSPEHRVADLSEAAAVILALARSQPEFSHG